jgi:uncharacterized membrane protein YuzA (DUF378 family)
MAKKPSALDLASWILCTVGALNWGIIGLTNYNVLIQLGAGFAQVAYIVIGLAGVFSLWHMFRHLNK